MKVLSDLDEILLGGVAGPNIGRLALKGDAFNTGFGYGVYFTDSRIIGLSYKRMLARSAYPGYLVFLAWAVWLTSALVYANLVGIPRDNRSLFYLDPPRWSRYLSFFLFWGPDRRERESSKNPPRRYQIS